VGQSKRQLILDYIKTRLSGLSALKHVELNRVTPVDLETTPYPCVFVYSGTEVRLTDDRAVIGQENWQWNITLEVWAKDDTDLEDLLRVIHEEMYNHYTLDGNAVYSVRIGSDMFTVDPSRYLKGMTVDYMVIYRHEKGIM